ncbi:MAG: DMT family transporter [Burkholderiaceae bacterium]|jgi:drug/metabolite transporter (DMT)-like permease|nr:DMT family transporter [Burkholderiaceae bacterium]
MTLTVSFAVLLAALLHASWNAMIKGGRDVLLDTAAIVAGAGVVALPFLFVVPLPSAAAWPYILASVATHLAYYYLMVNAYRTGDLSLVYPLMRGVAPLITALLGIVWLQEMPGPYAWLGMALISAGVIALALRTADHTPSRAAIGFALANACVIATYSIIDGTGARASGHVWSYIVWLFVIDAIPFTLFMLVTRRRAFVQALWARRRNGLIGGSLSAGAYAISVWAMTQAPVALVASLRETSVLFATLIGARLLKEKLTPRRWLGVGAVVLGVVALKAA